MSSPEEEKAWRLIVDHYDETATPDRPTPPGGSPEERTDGAPRRPETDGPGARADGAEPVEESSTDEPGRALPASDEFSPGPYVAPAEEPEPEPLAFEREEETFTLPPPPPAPTVPTGRRIAWAAVGGAPLVFLVAALTGNALPGAAAALLGVALAVGFVYLVLTMPGEPRDPWDDGSRV